MPTEQLYTAHELGLYVFLAFAVGCILTAIAAIIIHCKVRMTNKNSEINKLK